MSIKVYCGNASKRVNSTLQPPYGGWESFDAVWKGPVDADAPVVELYRSSNTIPNWNMMYIEETNAWYWISGVVSVRDNVWRVSGTMDYLATYKNDIIATPCYILYGSNPAASISFRVQDNRQNISQIPVVSTVDWDISAGHLSGDGIFVLSAVGKSSGVASYVISGSALERILDKVNEDLYSKIKSLEGRDLSDFINFNQLFQGTAIQAIRSCRWLPVTSATAAAIGVTQRQIYLGDFATGVQGGAMPSHPVYTVETDIAIPWQAGDWQRINSQISLYIPYIGTVSMPVDQCNNANSIHCTWSYDLIGGEMTVRLEASDYTFYVGSATTGADYAIGSSNIPTQNIISGAAQVVAGQIQVGGGMLSASAGVIGLVGSGGIGAALGAGSQISSGVSQMAAGTNATIQGVLQAITPVVNCSGTMGGSSAAGQSMMGKLTMLWYPPIDNAAFSALYQRPVMKIGTPLPGYCQTRGFSLAANALAAELSAINSAMDGGVFIE